MHYAEQVWAKRAKQSGKEEERQKCIGLTIDMGRNFGGSEEAIAAKLVELYKLSHKDAIAQVKARLSRNISNPALS